MIKPRLLLRFSITTLVYCGASAPAISSADNCLLSEVGSVWCTGYEFTLPVNIVSKAAPALTVQTQNAEVDPVANARAISVRFSNTAAGIVNQAAAVDIQPPANTGSGSITSYYGIFIGEPTAATNNYSIYSAGGKNFLGGDLEIKDTATLKVKMICDNAGANCKDISAGWGAGGGSGGGSGSVTQINSGNGLIGGPITSTGTIAVDVGITANKIVQLNGSAQLPAVSGANLTNINASSINGNAFSISSPSNGQVIGFNGSSWSNRTLSTSDIAGLAAAIGSKLDASNMPASCSANQTLTFTSPTGMWSCTSLVVTPAMFGSQPIATFLASPYFGSGEPSFRALNAADLPPEVSWQANGFGDLWRPTGKVGIGAIPTEKLSVAGIVQSTTGGFKFPDGTIQTTAATGGGGSGSGGTPHSFFVYKSNDQTLSTGAQLINWETIDFDTSNSFNLAADAFVPTVAGKYMIYVYTNIYQTAGSGTTSVGIFKNGSRIVVNEPRVFTGEGNTNLSVLVDMNGVSDFIQVKAGASSSSGNAIRSGKTNTYMYGYRISAINGTSSVKESLSVNDEEASANRTEINALKKENTGLKNLIELLERKSKLQEARLSNIEAMLSAKKVAGK